MSTGRTGMPAVHSTGVVAFVLLLLVANACTVASSDDETAYLNGFLSGSPIDKCMRDAGVVTCDSGGRVGSVPAAVKHCYAAIPCAQLIIVGWRVVATREQEHHRLERRNYHHHSHRHLRVRAADVSARWGQACVTCRLLCTVCAGDARLTPSGGLAILHVQAARADVAVGCNWLHS
jgi:hypothetical protein